jgi:hypothetical protein
MFRQDDNDVCFTLALAWAAILTVAGGAWSRSGRDILFLVIIVAVALFVVVLARYGRRVGLVVGGAVAWAATVLCALGALLLVPVLILPIFARLQSGADDEVGRNLIGITRSIGPGRRGAAVLAQV